MIRNKYKVILAYIFVTLTNILGTLQFPTITAYLMPIIFLTIPIILNKTINTRINSMHLIIGLLSSILVLIPILLYKLVFGLEIKAPPVIYIFITYLLVAFPEEVFFRGFLLDSIGCNLKGVIISSLLFSIAHWHRYLLYGDYLAPFTLFPALIMGLLYMKTRNTLPSTLFHGTCNILLFAIN